MPNTAVQAPSDTTAESVDYSVKEPTLTLVSSKPVSTEEQALGELQSLDSKSKVDTAPTSEAPPPGTEEKEEEEEAPPENKTLFQMTGNTASLCLTSINLLSASLLESSCLAFENSTLLNAAANEEAEYTYDENINAANRAQDAMNNRANAQFASAACTGTGAVASGAMTYRTTTTAHTPEQTTNHAQTVKAQTALQKPDNNQTNLSTAPALGSHDETYTNQCKSDLETHGRIQESTLKTNPTPTNRVNISSGKKIQEVDPTKPATTPATTRDETIGGSYEKRTPKEKISLEDSETSRVAPTMTKAQKDTALKACKAESAEHQAREHEAASNVNSRTTMIKMGSDMVSGITGGIFTMREGKDQKDSQVHAAVAKLNENASNQQTSMSGQWSNTANKMFDQCLGMYQTILATIKACALS